MASDHHRQQLTRIPTTKNNLARFGEWAARGIVQDEAAPAPLKSEYREASSFEADMFLRKARVTKYKCIEDSEEWRVTDVTCLVGKNEAGKSALLEALHKLNPDDPDVANFLPEDYPRRFALTPQGQQDLASANVLTTEWNLDPEECEYVNGEFPGLHLETEHPIMIKKGYDNLRTWDIPVDEAALVEALITSARLNAAESSVLKACSTIGDLGGRLANLEGKTDKHNMLERELKRLFPKLNAVDAISTKLQELLPKFV